MKNKNGVLLIGLGLLLIAAALFLAGYNIYDNYRAERSAGKALNQLDEYIDIQKSKEDKNHHDDSISSSEETEIPDYVLNPDMEMPVQTIDGQDYVGVLSIPALDLELPVISQWSYPKLKIAPCRYKGSAYLGDLVIAAHNYKSHFGSLKDLRQGDSVIFSDMDGNVFTYEVMELEALKSTDIEEMESGDWDLTLFTCTVGGQSRVTIRCGLVTD